jgi:hypothetical protein
MFGVGVGPKGLLGKGQLIHGMGLVWREAHILEQRAPTTSNSLLIFTLIATHDVLIIGCIC